MTLQCRPFLVGDLPFGCYESSPQEAVRNAVRVMKEGNMDAVKLEGKLYCFFSLRNCCFACVTDVVLLLPLLHATDTAMGMFAVSNTIHHVTVLFIS